MKLLGFKVVTGANKTTGNPYNGYRLYYSEEDKDGNLKYDDIYIDRKIAGEDLFVGEEFVVYYDRSGRIISMEYTGEVAG